LFAFVNVFELTKLTPAAAKAAICAAVKPVAAAAAAGATLDAAGAAAGAAAAAAAGTIGVDGVYPVVVLTGVLFGKPVLFTIGLVAFGVVGAVDVTEVDVGATPTMLVNGTGVCVVGTDAVPVPSDDRLVKSPGCGVLIKFGFKTDSGNCWAFAKSPNNVPPVGVVFGVPGVDPAGGKTSSGLPNPLPNLKFVGLKGAVVSVGVVFVGVVSVGVVFVAVVSVGLSAGAFGLIPKPL